jgi:hypothetical protein
MSTARNLPLRAPGRPAESAPWSCLHQARLTDAEARYDRAVQIAPRRSRIGARRRRVLTKLGGAAPGIESLQRTSVVL